LTGADLIRLLDAVALEIMFSDLGIISVFIVIYAYLENLRPFKYER
jgi:hypothetical protein